MSARQSNPRPQVEGSPLVADPRVRAVARHTLRQGGDPAEVAALIEVCVEDLADVLGMAS